MTRMNSCTLIVIYFSILQHKLVLFLPLGTFILSFSKSVITTDKVKRLQQTSFSLTLLSNFSQLAFLIV